MKKFVTLTLTFVLLLTALFLTACPEKQDPMNTVAYFEHGFSVDQMAILRYEYNEQGKILNILVLDWNTLFPAMNADKQDFDISYRYDKTGKLISHTFHGANMVLEYDENGHVKHSKGYRVGELYEIDYTCDENGTIRTVTLTKGEEPYIQQVVYEYTEDGKLQREGKYEHKYGDGEITVSNGDTKTAQTYRIKLNASSHIQEIAFQKKGDYPDYTTRDIWYEWSYDETGNCIASEGYSEYLDFQYHTICSMAYDKQGRLVEALTEVDEECPTMKSYAVSYEYGKDGLVSKATLQEVAVPGSTTTSDYNCVYEYVGGRLSKTTSEHLPTEKRAYTIRDTNIFDPSTGHYLTGTREYIDAQGNPVKPEGIVTWMASYEYDELGRRIYYRDTEYRSGEIEEDVEYFYHYNDQGEMDQTVKKVLKDIYGTTSTETTDYEGGIKTRETIEHFWNKEAHDLKKERRSLNVYDYDTEGRQTHYHLKTYDIDGETEILRGEEEVQYDFVPGNGIYERFSNALYDENGVLEQTNLCIDDEEGNSVVTTCDYENGVVRKKMVENRVTGKWIYDKGTAFSRPTDDTVEYFDASGKLEKTEVNEYEYHETNYRAKHTCHTYDPAGNLLETVVYEYDEAGNLIEK